MNRAKYLIGYTAAYTGLAYGGGVFIGVGTNAMVIASTNGAMWKAIDDKPDKVNWFDVCYGTDTSGNSIFVAVSFRTSTMLANVIIHNKFEVIRGNLMPIVRWRGACDGAATSLRSVLKRVVGSTHA